MSEIVIYTMTAEDAAEAAKVEAECFNDAWSEDSMRSTIEGRASLYVGCLVDGSFAGYCGTQVVLDEGEILRIAVLEEYRCCGLGSALLEGLWERTPQVRLWALDVREHNEPAQALYRKYGFVPVGIRKKYYHQPEEDAVLMQRIVEIPEPA